MLRTTKEGITVSVAETRTNRPVVDLYAGSRPKRSQPSWRIALSRGWRGCRIAGTLQEVPDRNGLGYRQRSGQRRGHRLRQDDPDRNQGSGRHSRCRKGAGTSRKQANRRQRQGTDRSVARRIHEIERRVTAFLKEKDRKERQAAAEAAARAEAEALRLMDEAATTGSQEAETAAVDAIAEQQAAEAVVEAPTPELSRFKTANSGYGGLEGRLAV